MRMFLRIVAGLAVVVVFFLGTLFVLDFGDPAAASNRIRADHARLLSDALEKFRQARGTYPQMSAHPVDDLKKDLVDGGFLKAIPADPAKSSKGWQYLYLGEPNMYGMLFVQESRPYLTGKKTGGPCVVGVKIKGTGAWGDPPECQF